MTLEDKKMPKNADIFLCESCDFKCCKLSNFKKHISTLKHKKNDQGLLNDYILSSKNAENALSSSVSCICGKQYIYKQGLWKHKKTCTFFLEKQNYKQDEKQEEEKQEESIDTQLDKYKEKDAIMLLVQQNNDFKELLLEQNKMMMEICKDKSITNYTNTNSNNKTFNLQFFLNETCKDAMNIMDFVDSVKLQLSDLENVGKLGFVDGISDIIVKNLKALDIEKRPVHCTDSKREVMYIKDQDIWYNDSNEEEENKKLKKAIKRIVNKNTKLLPEFKAKYPDCIYSDSKKSDQYNKIIIEAFGGSKNEDVTNENKIIKKIAKEVSIDKLQLFQPFPPLRKVLRS